MAAAARRAPEASSALRAHFPGKQPTLDQQERAEQAAFLKSAREYSTDLAAALGTPSLADDIFKKSGLLCAANVEGKSVFMQEVGDVILQHKETLLDPETQEAALAACNEAAEALEEKYHEQADLFRSAMAVLMAQHKGVNEKALVVLADSKKVNSKEGQEALTKALTICKDTKIVLVLADCSIVQLVKAFTYGVNGHGLNTQERLDTSSVFIDSFSSLLNRSLVEVLTWECNEPFLDPETKFAVMEDCFDFVGEVMGSEESARRLFEGVLEKPWDYSPFVREGVLSWGRDVKVTQELVFTYRTCGVSTPPYLPAVLLKCITLQNMLDGKAYPADLSLVHQVTADRIQSLQEDMSALQGNVGEMRGEVNAHSTQMQELRQKLEEMHREMHGWRAMAQEMAALNPLFEQDAAPAAPSRSVPRTPAGAPRLPAPAPASTRNENNSANAAGAVADQLAGMSLGRTIAALVPDKGRGSTRDRGSQLGRAGPGGRSSHGGAGPGRGGVGPGRGGVGAAAGVERGTGRSGTAAAGQGRGAGTVSRGWKR